MKKCEYSLSSKRLKTRTKFHSPRADVNHITHLSGPERAEQAESCSELVVHVLLLRYLTATLLHAPLSVGVVIQHLQLSYQILCCDILHKRHSTAAPLCCVQKAELRGRNPAQRCSVTGQTCHCFMALPK